MTFHNRLARYIYIHTGRREGGEGRRERLSEKERKIEGGREREREIYIYIYR